MASIYSGYNGVNLRTRLDYTYTQDVNANTSTVNCSLYMENGSSTDFEPILGGTFNVNGSITLDGTTVSRTSVTISKIPAHGSILVGSYSKVITHNANGEKQIYVQGSTEGMYTPNTLVTLEKINRTSPATLSRNNFNVGDHIVISTNRKDGSFTHRIWLEFGSINTLIASGVGAEYIWYTNATADLFNQIVNASSGSGSIIVDTYSGGTFIGNVTLPFTANCPVSIPSLSKSDFNIGENITVNTNRISNSGYTHRVWLVYGTINKIIASGVEDNWVWDTDVNQDLYSQIATANNGTGALLIDTYKGTAFVGNRTAGFTCRVVNSHPIFSDFDFEDVNEMTTVLTGNNKKIIKGYSNIKTIISIENKAVAQNSSSIKRYRTEIGNLSKEVDFSNTAEVNMLINNVESNLIYVRAIDSRGNATIVQKTATLIDYSSILLQNIKIERKDGISTTCSVVGNGTYKNINFGVQTNSVAIEYRKKNVNSSTWDDWVNITSLFNIADGIIENKSTGNEIAGFDIGVEYDVQIVATDKLTSFALTSIINDGDGSLVINKSRKLIGIGKIPLKTLAKGTLDVLKAIYVDNKKILVPYTLFSNSSGSTSTVTLSETAGDFEEIEIRFCNKFGGTNRYNSIKCKNGEVATLMTTRAGSTYIYFFSAEVSISGTTITWINNYYQILNLSGNTVATDNLQYITEVIGYK